MSKKTSNDNFLEVAYQAGERFAHENLYRMNSFEQEKNVELMDKLLVRYATEGHSGGNCYDGQAHYYSHDLEDRIAAAQSDLGLDWQFKDKFYQFNMVECRNYIADLVTKAEEDEAFIVEGIEHEYYGNNTTRRLIAGDIEQLKQFFGNAQAGEAFIQGFKQVLPELKVQLQTMMLNNVIRELNRDHKNAERDVLNHEKNMQEQDKKLLAEKKALLKKIAEIDAHFENQNTNHMKKLIEVQQKFATINEQLEQAKAQLATLTGQKEDSKKPKKKH
jgi:hypothetical protein